MKKIPTMSMCGALLVSACAPSSHTMDVLTDSAVPDGSVAEAAVVHSASSDGGVTTDAFASDSADVDRCTAAARNSGLLGRWQSNGSADTEYFYYPGTITMVFRCGGPRGDGQVDLEISTQLDANEDRPGCTYHATATTDFDTIAFTADGPRSLGLGTRSFSETFTQCSRPSDNGTRMGASRDVSMRYVLNGNVLTLTGRYDVVSRLTRVL
jgi:hypothetical protein